MYGAYFNTSERKLNIKEHKGLIYKFTVYIGQAVENVVVL